MSQRPLTAPESTEQWLPHPLPPSRVYAAYKTCFKNKLVMSCKNLVCLLKDFFLFQL